LTTHAGCSSSSDTPPSQTDAGGDAPQVLPSDANTPLDANTPACDPHKPFGSPVLVQPVASLSLGGVFLSADELTIYATSRATGHDRIATATRAKMTDAFGPLTPVPALESSITDTDDDDPFIAGDDKTLYFASTRQGTGLSALDLFAAVHDPITGAFQTPVPVANVNSDQAERGPTLSHDQSTLYFASFRDGSYRIYQSTSSNGTFDAPSVVDLGMSSGDGSPVLTSDELTLIFNSYRSATSDSDIWMATRSAKPGDFGTFTNQGDVAALNSASNDVPNWLSADGCRLYLSSDRPVVAGGRASLNIYLATRPK